MIAILRGLAAGLAGTIPMTAFTLAGLQALPEREQYPLPPEEITADLSVKAGIGEIAAEPRARRAATGVNHFAYGSAAGVAYALTASRLPWHPVLKGSAFGLLVWAGSYMGWLPAAGILRAASEHPARRTALMVASHLVWGSVTALVEEALD